jgi:hypothetical protein
MRFAKRPAFRSNNATLLCLLEHVDRDAVRLVSRRNAAIDGNQQQRVLAYFGYPHAHENDAEQAVRVGIAIVHAVGDLLADRLKVRLGVANWLAIVGGLIRAGASQTGQKMQQDFLSRYIPGLLKALRLPTCNNRAHSLARCREL